MYNCLSIAEEFDNGKYQSYNKKRWSKGHVKTLHKATGNMHKFDDRFVVSTTQNRFANSVSFLLSMLTFVINSFIIKYLPPPPPANLVPNFLNFR
jgi:hypothetical protein